MGEVGPEAGGSRDAQQRKKRTSCAFTQVRLTLASLTPYSASGAATLRQLSRSGKMSKRACAECAARALEGLSSERRRGSASFGRGVRGSVVHSLNLPSPFLKEAIAEWALIRHVGGQ